MITVIASNTEKVWLAGFELDRFNGPRQSHEGWFHFFFFFNFNLYLTSVASGKCKWLEIWYTRPDSTALETVWEDLAGSTVGTHRVARQEEWSGEEGVIRYVSEESPRITEDYRRG
jgi:hypothetical protein